MQHIRMPLPHEREPLERRLPYLKPDVMDFLKVHLACTLPAPIQTSLVLACTCNVVAFCPLPRFQPPSAEGRGRSISSCHHHLYLSLQFTARRSSADQPFLQACLHPVPSKRRSCWELLQMPYLSDSKSLFSLQSPLREVDSPHVCLHNLHSNTILLSYRLALTDWRGQAKSSPRENGKMILVD